MSEQAPLLVQPRRRALGTLAAAALMALIAGLFFLTGLTSSRLVTTEGNRVVTAQEMMARGSLAVPWMYGRPYLAKPPGIYVAIIAASRLLDGGVTELSSRLPSALAAAATVLLAFFAVARAFGPRAGLTAGLMTMMTTAFIDKSASADIEMLLVCLITASLFAQWRALDASGRGARLGWWLAAYLAMGLAFLTKGPPAPIFFYAALVPWAARRRRWRALGEWTHWVGFAAAAGVVAAWLGLLAHEVGWQAILARTGGETAARFVLRWRYPLDAVLHPLKAAAALLPWSPFALLALARPVRAAMDGRGRDFADWLAGFIAASLVFWSLLPAHPIRYVYPMFPAVTCLAAAAWDTWVAHHAARNDARAWAWFVRLNWMGLACCALVSVGGMLRVVADLGRHIPVAVSLSAMVMAGAVWGMSALTARRRAAVILGWALIWLGVKLAFVEIYYPERNLRKANDCLGRAIARCTLSDTLHVFRNVHQSMLWYSGRNIRQGSSPNDLPPGPGPFYCLLTPRQYEAWHTLPQFETALVRSFHDSSDEPCILVTMRRR